MESTETTQVLLNRTRSARDNYSLKSMDTSSAGNSFHENNHSYKSYNRLEQNNEARFKRRLY